MYLIPIHFGIEITQTDKTWQGGRFANGFYHWNLGPFARFSNLFGRRLVGDFRIYF